MFDPAQHTLRRRLDAGESLGFLWLSLGSVALCEIAARARPDVIVLDLQHGLWDRGAMEHAIGIVPPGIPVLVRVGENSPLAISQALDAGAEGILVPLVETGEQAARAASACRYPPHGARSGGGIRPLADFPAYVEAAVRGIVVCVMIETAAGVAQAQAIASAPGVDAVFIGTGDLALSLGTFPGPGTRHDEACAQVLEACNAAGVPCGIFTPSPQAGAARIAEGYRMVVAGNDIDIAAKGFAGAVGAVRTQD